MSSKIRLWIACAALVAVAGLFGLAGTAGAGKGKGIQGEIAKIAAAHAKGDKAGAATEAKAAAKGLEELYEMMELFKPVKKGGYPVKGFKDTEGIEQQLRLIARDAPANFAKEADTIHEMGFVTAAIADVTEQKAPTKDSGKKTRKDWVQWSQDMRTASLELAGAKSANEVKTAAAKVNASCNNCHSVFRQ